jgi:hypothetical protein
MLENRYAQDQAAKNEELEAGMLQALKMLGKTSSGSTAVTLQSASSSSSLEFLAQLARARIKGQWKGSSRVDAVHVCFGK